MVKRDSKNKKNKKKSNKQQWSFKKLFALAKEQRVGLPIGISLIIGLSLFAVLSLYHATEFFETDYDLLQPRIPKVLQSGSLCVQYSNLNGECFKVSEENDEIVTSLGTNSAANEYALPVIIENSLDARPLAGINEASLVFEALAEGTITRFLAIFSSNNDIESIGPVRSVRPYFVDWAHQFQGILAHVGGSPKGLEMIRAYQRNSTMVDFDEYHYGRQYYTRSTKRSAPHNVFTSTKMMSSFIDTKSEQVKKTVPVWKFKDDADYDTLPQDQQTITVPYISSAYTVDWKYDIANNEYQRSQGGKAYYDAAGEQVTAKNIIVLQMNTLTIDQVGRRSIEMIGEGNGYAFRDGKYYQVTWSKESSTDPLIIKNKYGKQFVFNAGKIWFNIVPHNHIPEINGIEVSELL